MNNKTKGIMLAILGPFLWCVSGSIAQYLFSNYNVDVHWLITMRMFISGSVLVAYALLTNKTATLAPLKTKSAILPLFGFSILGMFASQYTYFMAVKVSSAATATVLQFLSPVLIIVYLAVTTWHLPRRIDVLTVLIAILGTLILVTHGQFTSLSLPFSGVVWGLASAVTGAVYTLMPRHLLHTFGSIPIVGWAMLFGGIVSIVVFQTWKSFPKFDPRLYLYVTFVVFFGTMLAYLFYLQSLNYIEPTVTSVLGAFEPLSAAVISVLFLGVAFGFSEVLGTTLILSTAVIQFWANRIHPALG